MSSLTARHQPSPPMTLPASCTLPSGLTSTGDTAPTSGRVSRNASSGVSQPAVTSMSALRKHSSSVSACRTARLPPAPKPRFSDMRSTVAPVRLASSHSPVPSGDALSTTITRYGSVVCSASSSRHRTTSSRPP
jgi:hypothetical protein